MGRPKKDRSEADDSMVNMLSLRPGDIKLEDGTTIVKGKIFKVDEETAQWLEISFKEFMQRVD